MPDIDWRVNADNREETIVTTPSASTRRWRVSLLALMMVLGASLGAIYSGIKNPAPRPTATPIATPVPTLTPIPITKTPTPIPTPPLTKIVVPTRAAAKTGTELRLNLKNPAGQPISVTTALLVWNVWGGGRGIDLEAHGNQIILPLDEDWLRSRLDYIAYISWDFLLIESDGYVPLRSKDFTWIGSNGKQDRADIEFPNGPHIIVPEGEKRNIDLVVRKPQPRYLRLIDDLGRPVSGVKVTGGVFNTDGNHCGVLSTSFYHTSTSDSKGQAQILDGDFEYAFVFEKAGYMLTPTVSLNPQRLITYVTSAKTTIQLRQMLNRPLDLRITQNGKPAPEISVLGSGLTGWGGCGGVLLGKSDEAGYIHLAEFYPEMWRQVYLVYEAHYIPKQVSFTDDKDLIGYPDDPRKWPNTGIIHIDFIR